MFAMSTVGQILDKLVGAIIKYMTNLGRDCGSVMRGSFVT